MPISKKAPVKRATKYVTQKVAPIVKADVQKVLALPQWMVYVIAGLLIIILSKVFVIDGCNKNRVDANAEKVKELEEKLEKAESENAVIIDSLNSLDKILDDLYVQSNEASKNRKEIEIDGEVQRGKAKIITDEVKAKINDPRTTDSERDSIERELLRARRAAKVFASE